MSRAPLGDRGHGMAVIPDEQWPAARLIPISSASGVEAQERRAASALLAVMVAVPEFARALLKPMGAPAGRLASLVLGGYSHRGRGPRGLPWRKRSGPGIYPRRTDPLPQRPTVWCGFIRGDGVLVDLSPGWGARADFTQGGCRCLGRSGSM